MKGLEKYSKNVVVMFAAILLLIAAPTNGSAAFSHFTVITPNEAQAQTGMTYAEWSVKWWQYILETPLENNPAVDPTGANCQFGQSGPVFFLVSTSGGTATRSECVVPAGKILFFPLLGFSVFRSADDGQREHSLRNYIGSFIKSTKNLQVTIDGEEIGINLNPKTTPLRTRSPAGFFTVTAPENNVFGGVAGQSYDTVSDGFYLMVAPLSPGPHTITFGGSSRNFESYVTYNLIVEEP